MANAELSTFRGETEKRRHGESGGSSCAVAERSCKHNMMMISMVWLNFLTKSSRNYITLSVSLNSSVIYVKYAGSLN